ncbi:MAG TPA: ABC transporter permease [Rhizomicrobium sp.]|nr:ABC transporter permease [Rhizomicrobium sp.]
MSLIFRLASRNLFQDRLRFIATIIGIVFSIVLVSVQLGLFLGFQKMVTTMIDHTPADLWVVSRGTKCFEDPSLLDKHDQAKALSVPGVSEVVPLIIGFSEWSVPHDGTTPVFVVGTTPKGLQPWHVVQGSFSAVSDPHGVAIDRSYFGRLGVSALGDTTTIRNHTVAVKAITQGIRSFTTTPYVFAPLDSAQTYIGTAHNEISYLLVHLAHGADAAQVRNALLHKLDKVEVLTPLEFRDRSRSFWLFGTGAGFALFGGALLGAIVGTVIIAQTLYSSTKDHLTEFATLRAIGSSSLYIHKVIITQALLSAVIGFGAAAVIDFIVVWLTFSSALPIVMTPVLTLGLFVLTVVMCVVSAVSAIVQVTRIDPARVFKS